MLYRILVKVDLSRPSPAAMQVHRWG